MGVGKVILFISLLFLRPLIMGFKNKSFSRESSLIDQNDSLENEHFFGVHKCCVAKKCSPQRVEEEFCSAGKFKVEVREDYVLHNGVLTWDNLNFSADNFCLMSSVNGTSAVICITPDGSLGEKAIGLLGLYT